MEKRDKSGTVGNLAPKRGLSLQNRDSWQVWECQDVVCSLPGTGCSHLFHVRVLRYIHHHAFRDSEATLDKGRFATR